MVTSSQIKLLKSVILLCIGLLLFSCKSAALKNDSLTILQITDPQLGFFDDNKSTTKDIANLNKGIMFANHIHPDLVIMTGDLINKPFDNAQLTDFFNATKNLDKKIPLYFAAGNHDVGNTPNNNDIIKYRKLFGQDFYSIDRKNTIAIVLNSLYLFDNQNVSNFSNDQLIWLKKTLAEADKKNITNRIVFLHHPLFLKEPSEEDEYFNIPKKIRQPYLELFKKYKVSHVFSGHYHRNSFGKYEAMEMVTTGPIGKPLGKDNSGVRVIMIKNNAINHKYLTLDSIAQ